METNTCVALDFGEPERTVITLAGFRHNTMKNQECHSTFAAIRAFFSHSRYCPTVDCQACRATVLPLRHRRTILGNVASFSHFSACSCHVGIQPCSEFQALKAQESERLPSLARCPRNAKRIGDGAVPTDSLSSAVQPYHCPWASWASGKRRSRSQPWNRGSEEGRELDMYCTAGATGPRGGRRRLRTSPKLILKLEVPPGRVPGARKPSTAPSRHLLELVWSRLQLL